MSTSLLYHAFGIRGYQYVRTESRDGQVIFTLRQESRTCRCPACGSPQVRSRGRVERRFRSLPIGRRATIVVLPIPRVECRACGAIRQAEVPFADPRRSYTRAFERYALELARRMTIRDVALHLGVGWDLIKEIQKRDLARRFAKPKLKHLRWIAIDEIAVAKGHRYLTVVLDLESGAVVFVGDGKGADALKPFWKRLRPSKARIAAVAMDMSAAYCGAVSTHLPGATIVFDHFHVVKLFNDKLSELRRAVYREATDVRHKEVLKGTRWLLQGYVGVEAAQARRLPPPQILVDEFGVDPTDRPRLAGEPETPPTRAVFPALVLAPRCTPRLRGVSPHEPVQLVAVIPVHHAVGVLVQKPLDDHGNGGVHAGVVVQQFDLLTELQQGLLGLELRLGILGAGDQNLVAFAAEVGTPGTPRVPRPGRTCHRKTLEGNIPRNFPESLVGRAEGNGKPGYGTAIPARVYVISPSVGARGFEPPTSRTRTERL
jgi:hypothetical protein